MPGLAGESDVELTIPHLVVNLTEQFLLAIRHALASARRQTTLESRSLGGS